MQKVRFELCKRFFLKLAKMEDKQGKIIMDIFVRNIY